MKKIRTPFIAILMALSTVMVFSASIESYLEEASKLRNEDKIDQAVAVMEKAVVEYPKNAPAWNLLAELIGAQVQQNPDFTTMFGLIGRAFSSWDRALEIDPTYVPARINRGAWAVNIPKFAGQLDKGVEDLAMVVKMLAAAPDSQSARQLIGLSELLGKGLQKQGNYEGARMVWLDIIKRAPGSEPAKTAQENLDGIDRVLAWYKENGDRRPEIAELRADLQKEPGRVDLWVRLATVLGEEAQVGYDPRIFLDTDFRTDLAFEGMNALDRAVALAPDDPELRLAHASNCVNMPFFVGKLDAGIEELQKLIAQDPPAAVKSEAMYLLGYAYQKKANTQWINVVSKFPGTEAAKHVFTALEPNVTRWDPGVKPPFLAIDFIMGYKDELAPQTAVWIQDRSGAFVKTVYVSGFSGNARMKQVDLPVYAEKSKFADVDAVTGASIDLGHHLFQWDLRNFNGQAVKNGTYVVCIEVSFWPSMQYQRIEVPVDIGKKDVTVIRQEGDLIPFVEVSLTRK